ncbi:hypothetical protein EYF80_004889 [Liparis tanakae]|uniref:Uncharacterized protein n=1 Tax=Liparis tanakae TaxID=230148 RepID=A0A4Z2J4M6_9TELE|nr:hypothetical protein EYF80_004889 [Liparis tanakae]
MSQRRFQKNLTPFPSSMTMISALPSAWSACSERSSIQSSRPWNSGGTHYDLSFDARPIDAPRRSTVTSGTI